ncbi:6-hydroxy-D-nicotine oxidase [Rhypophila decipiens]
MYLVTLISGGLALLDGALAYDCCAKLTKALPSNRVFLPGSSSTLAKGPECLFAIKSGGHNANPKFNNIDNGVTIDLKLLNTASLSPNKSYITLGAGTTMGQAYAAVANNTGLVFPGGICDGVGAGGVATGGGQSFFLPKVGWVVDNILRYEVVLASGEIITASPRKYSDLYKALKGGATNFGIVTSVAIQTFPHPGSFRGGQLVVPATNTTNRQVLERAANFTTMNNEHVDAAIMIVGLYTPDGHRIVDIGLAATDNVANPPILAPFFDVQPQVLNTIGHKSLQAFVHEVTQPMPDGFREATATLTVKNDLETLLQIQTLTDTLYAKIKHKVPTLDWMFSYNPQPKVMTTHAAKNGTGGNSLGLDNLQHDQMLWWLIPRWSDPASDALVQETVATWVREATRIATDLGTFDPFLYVNHAGYFQKPFCGTGEENIKFMRRVAGKYDPGRVFQTLVPGGHKISTKC